MPHLDLLRHEGHLYRGSLFDDSLTGKDWQQIQISTADKHWDFIAILPMIRCQAFIIRVIKSHLPGLAIEKMLTMEVASASCERFEL